MSFGRLQNRHDRWKAFCSQYREQIVASGLPEAITNSEPLFRDLLRDGTASGRGTHATLAGLSAEHWVRLSQFVDVFFNEFESFAPLDLFPAFRREAERRDTTDKKTTTV